MIIRIVKMGFDPNKTAEFLNVFHASKEKIRSMKGCNRLELLKDVSNDSTFFTYSYWDSETDLNNYRDSELFKEVWSKTKILFNVKPEAWSVNSIVKLD